MHFRDDELDELVQFISINSKSESNLISDIAIELSRSDKGI